MSAPPDTVSWCPPERFHVPLTASFKVPRPNWKAECGENRLLRLERGKGRKILPIAINEAKAIYKQCKPNSSDFRGFSSYEELSGFGKDCSKVLGSTFLCKVEFDPVYGYPKSITWFNPNVSDGMGGFEITKFQIDQPK